MGCLKKISEDMSKNKTSKDSPANIRRVPQLRVDRNNNDTCLPHDSSRQAILNGVIPGEISLTSSRSPG